MQNIKFYLLAAASVFVFLFSSVAAQAQDLIYVEHNIPESFNPLRAQDGPSLRLAGAVYSGLVRYTLSADVEPVMVEKVSKGAASEFLSIESCGCVKKEDKGDSVAYKFVLKDDLKWHNGEKLRPEDVRATYEALRKNPGAYSFSIKYLNNIEVDGRSITFTIKKGINPIELFMVPVIPAPAARDDDDKKLSGSGFFKIDKRDIDRITLKRFVEARDLQNPIKQLTMLRTTRESSDVNALINEKVHFIPAVSYYYARRIDENPSLRLYPYYVNNMSSIAINLRKADLKDRKLREALQLAVDRDDLLAKFFPTSRRLNGPLSPASPFYVDADEQDTDLEKAKKLVRETGFNRTLTLRVQRSRLGDYMLEGLVEYLIKRWKDAGITVVKEVKEGNDAVFKKDLVRGDFDLAFVVEDFGRSFMIEPYYIANGEKNTTGYRNQTVDDLFKQAARARDVTELRSVYERIQNTLREDIPYIYLFEEKRYAAYHKTVKTKGLLIPDNLFGLIDRWEMGK